MDSVTGSAKGSADDRPTGTHFASRPECLQTRHLYAAAHSGLRNTDITALMAEENSTGSNAVWAIALVIIVAIVAGLIYYSGILKTSPKKEIDINVTVPAR